MRVQPEKYSGPNNQVSKSVQLKTNLEQKNQVSKSAQLRTNMESKNQVSKSAQLKENPKQKQGFTRRRTCMTA